MFTISLYHDKIALIQNNKGLSLLSNNGSGDISAICMIHDVHYV